MFELKSPSFGIGLTTEFPKFKGDYRIGTVLCTMAILKLLIYFRFTLLMLEDEQRKKGVIAASAGNHAQALAYHGGLLGKF